LPVVRPVACYVFKLIRTTHRTIDEVAHVDAEKSVSIGQRIAFNAESQAKPLKQSVQSLLVFCCKIRVSIRPGIARREKLIE